MATTYYGSPSGNNGNPGTLASPFLTLNYSVGVLTPGDTLRVRAGTYKENLNDPAISGTNWTTGIITIAAYPGETVTLAPSSGQIGVRLTLAQRFIEFDGINVEGADSASCVFCDERTGGTSMIRWKNATLHTPGTSGGSAAIVAGTVGNEFTNLIVHGQGGPYGFYLSGDYNLVDGCDIYDTATAGVQIYHSGGNPTGNIVRNSRIHDLTASYFFGVPDPRMWGIIVQGTNNEVYNNLIYRIQFPYQSSNAGIYVYGGSGHQIYFNTIADATTDGIYVNAGVVGAVLQDNIVAPTVTGVALADYGTGTTKDHNLTGTDPAFGGGDYRLLSGSPAIDAGVAIGGITSDFFGGARPYGSAPDIGAHEYGATPGTSVVGSRPPLPPPVSSKCCTSAPGSGGGGGCSCDHTPAPGTAPPGTPGVILPPVDPTAWTPQCTGGGLVLAAADLSDSESWAA